MEWFFEPIKNAAGCGGNLSPDGSVPAGPRKEPYVGALVNLDDIVADPGLRKQMEEYDLGVKDQVRMRYLLIGPCQPSSRNFSRKRQGNRSSSFNEAWFSKFDWLEYSVAKDAAYCFYCYLFKQPTSGNCGSDVFSTTGFRNWDNAMEAFIGHTNGVNSSHNNARQQCENFKIRRQIMPFSTHISEMETAHRTCMAAVLDVARFLLLQGLAFSGPDESSNSINKGNFLEMLNWYRNEFESIDLAFNENTLDCDAMTYPVVQKDLVKSCAELTAWSIVDEIGDSYFSLIFYEPHGSPEKDKMAVIVRFVSKQGQLIERLLGIEYVADDAPSLKIALDGLFDRYGLSISKLRGQAYNPSTNMREQFNELKSLILSENPYALYTHCFSHQFQSVVVSAANSISFVGNFFYHVSWIVRTVGASCRSKDALLQEYYEKTVDCSKSGDALSGGAKHQEHSLAGSIRMCWGSYFTTLFRLLAMWNTVLDALMIVADDASIPEQTTEAANLIRIMESFEFVFILHLMVQVMCYTDYLSSLLEEKDKYIPSAMDVIVTVKSHLQDLKDNGWDEFLENVKSFCVTKSIPVPNMEDSVPFRGRSRGRGAIGNLLLSLSI